MASQIITIGQALEIARHEIARVISESDRLSQYSFGEAGFLREDERVWTFAAGSEELIEQGYVSGAVIISVDKKDGHVWTREEMEQYSLERERMKRGAQAAV
jgi:hypothetical protein